MPLPSGEAPASSRQCDARFALSSGVVVHNWRCESPRATIILQHGFREYAERYVSSYSQLVPALNAKGCQVWAMDLWGHGSSPGNRAMVHVEKAVQDHIELRRRAVAQALPLFVMGHSLGGLITAASTACDGSDLQGTVLFSPALPQPMAALAEGAIGFIASITPAMHVPTPARPPEMLSHDPTLVSQAESDPMILKTKVPFLLAATALRASRAMWARLSEWRVPTLVLHGTEDVHADWTVSKRLVDNIASTDKTLHLVDGGYHELLNDQGADEVLQLVLAWIEERALVGAYGILVQMR